MPTRKHEVLNFWQESFPPGTRRHLLTVAPCGNPQMYYWARVHASVSERVNVCSVNLALHLSEPKRQGCMLSWGSPQCLFPSACPILGRVKWEHTCLPLLKCLSTSVQPAWPTFFPLLRERERAGSWVYWTPTIYWALKMRTLRLRGTKRPPASLTPNIAISRSVAVLKPAKCAVSSFSETPSSWPLCSSLTVALLRW